MAFIHVAIVGLGYWGPNLVRNFLKIPDVKVSAICDVNIKTLNNLSSQYPHIKTTTDYNQLLHDEKIDLIAIATPSRTHYEIGQKVLRAKKHVLIEKPMTQSSDEAKPLIELAEKNNRLIMVGHTFIYSEPIKKIKEMLEKKALGKIYYYDSTRINLGIIQSDLNVIWDLAPHDFSILNFLFQEKPLSLTAVGSSHIHKNNEEMAHIIVTYEKNITAHIHLSWLSPVKIRSILIGGSKKMIVYDDIEPTEKIRVYDKNTLPSSSITPFSPAYRSGDILIPRLKQEEALYNELFHFIECIQKKRKPLSDGSDGLKVVRLLEATDQALKSKKEILLHNI